MEKGRTAFSAREADAGAAGGGGFVLGAEGEARGFEGLAEEGQSGGAGGALFGLVDRVAVQARARGQVLIAPAQRRLGHLDLLRRDVEGGGWSVLRGAPGDALQHGGRCGALRAQARPFPLCNPSPHRPSSLGAARGSIDRWRCVGRLQWRIASGHDGSGRVSAGASLVIQGRSGSSSFKYPSAFRCRVRIRLT